MFEGRRFVAATLTLLAATGLARATSVRGLVSIDLTEDDRYAVVACRRDNSIAILDLATAPYAVRNVTDGIPRCPIVVRCFGSTAIVTGDCDEHIAVVDVPTGRVVSKVKVPYYCHDVVWDAARSRYYVSNRWKESILVFDSEWRPVGPGDGVPCAKKPGPMVLGPDGRLYVGNRGSWDVSVLDMDRMLEVARVPIGSRPEDLAATATALLVTNHGGADLPRVNGVPLIRNDQVDIRNVVTSIDFATLATTDMFVDHGADYSGIDVRDGLVAFAGTASGTVHAHRASDSIEKLVTVDLLEDGTLPGGRTPDGRRVYSIPRDVAVRSADQIFAANFLRATVAELRSAPDGGFRVVGETPLASTGQPIQAFPTPAGSTTFSALQSGDLFLLTIAAWQGGHKDFSCVTCHSDWHSDFRLSFDPKPDPFDPSKVQGAERHPSLRFSKLTAPFGWEGAFSDLAGVNASALATHNVRLPNDEFHKDVAKLLTLIEEVTLPGPNPNPPNERGKRLFDGKAGCVECHPAPLYTDNAFHDVGTGRKLNTPTLLGVWDQPRYLHDARAESIEDVLDPAKYRATGPSHGNIAGLSAEERADLAAFVRSVGDGATGRKLKY